MYESMDEKTDDFAGAGGNGKVSDQVQMQRSYGEDGREYDPGLPHTHIDENGHVYTHTHTHGAHSHHVHSAEEKRAVINRLSRAIGHLESVKRMVERDEDCSEVLIQLAAVRNAINNTGKVIMKNHISHCMVEAIEENDLEAVEALTHAIDHFIK